MLKIFDVQVDVLIKYINNNKKLYYYLCIVWGCKGFDGVRNKQDTAECNCVSVQIKYKR